MNEIRTIDDRANEEAFYAGFTSMQSDDLGDYKAPEQTLLYKEECSKCRGKGFIGSYAFRDNGRCYQCDGAGFKMFKQPKDVRERKRAQVRASKEKRCERQLEAFESEHPALAEWWKDSTFPFAMSLRESAYKYGDLTEGQMVAAYKCALKFQSAKSARQDAPPVDISGLERAFEKAKGNGLLRVKLRLLGNDSSLLFQPANEQRAKPENQGAIYVKDEAEGTYLGKIKDGKFYRSRDCSEIQYAAVLEACKAPEEAAVAFGKKFGSCSCCGRTLTNELSIELGIGPICRSKFFG